MKKRKLKIKKNVLLIFIIIIIIGSLTITKILVPSKSKKTNNIKENKVAKKTQPESPNQKKLNQLQNINEKLDFFNYDYLDRYIEYQKNHPEMTIENIIVYVNIGLDKPFYENVKETEYPQTSYMIANKYNSLSNTYVPENLEAISTEYAVAGMKMVNYAKDAFEELAQAAKNEGYTIRAMSTYRSYEYQQQLYNRYAANDGVEAADTYSARAGYSEHQTGLAADVDNGKISYTSFETTEEFKWMQNNAYKYGFILRYPADKVAITGYMPEAWHYRYVGKEIAKVIQDTKMTYEEYYVRYIEKKK